MRTAVLEHTSTRLQLAANAAIDIVQVRALEDAGIEDLADVTREDDFPCFPESLAEAFVEYQPQRHAVALGAGYHFLALAQSWCHRLLAQNVAASIHALHRIAAVQRHRGCHADDFGSSASSIAATFS